MTRPFPDLPTYRDQAQPAGHPKTGLGPNQRPPFPGSDKADEAGVTNCHYCVNVWHRKRRLHHRARVISN